MKKRKVYASGAIYEGEMKAGKRHGNGKMTWPDGRSFDGVWSEDNIVKGRHTWPSGVVYEGTWNNWKRNGYGINEYNDGGRYAGEWKDDKRHGNGQMTWADGKTFDGVWSEDNIVKGRHTWPDGTIYEGAWENWKRNGYGTQQYSNGGRYAGEWKDDKRHGNGKMTWADGKTFDGVWSEDKIVKGRHTWPNGTIYEGALENWKRSGYGTNKYSDGRLYSGEWKDDNRHGNGKMTWADGRTFDGVWSGDEILKGRHTWPDGTTYEGTWKDWKRSGYGINKYSDGGRYSGEWKDDNRHGNGKMTWADGKTFDGVWSGDEILKGRHTWPDGTTYEGTWKDWKRNGYGIQTYRSGAVYDGEWKDDKRHGKGTMTGSDGSVKTGEWVGDEFLGNVNVQNGTRTGTTNTAGTTNTSATGNNGQNSAGKPQDQSVENMLKTGGYLTVGASAAEARYPEPLRRHFSTLVGMDEVKSVIARLYDRFVYDRNREKMLGISPDKKGYNFVITGNPGTGKTTVARILAAILNDVGILPEAKLVETDRSGLVGEHIGSTAKLTAAVIDKARGGTLFIDEAYSLYVEESGVDFGVEAINTLLKDMEDHRGEYAVVLAGYKEEMGNMLRKANPGFASRFDHIINIPDYSAGELLQMIVKQALKENYVIEKDAEKRILRRIEAQMMDLHFDNGRYARKLLDQAKDRLAARVVRLPNPRKEDFQILKAEDFGAAEEGRDKLTEYLAELDAMVGLRSVKREVRKLVSAVKYKKELESRNLPGSAIGSLNLVFTGNPGTGKTTVARLLGNIYYELGLLRRKGCFVECGRSDLVGQYLGQTAPRVKARVEEALGGILFIDEAYALCNAENDSFGMEAINALVPLIENHRKNLMVILAGYTDEMEKFMASNPGLSSRISRTIEFPDYTDEELVEIFVRRAEHAGYTVSCDRELLRRCIAERKAAVKDFGNGRGVRNLLEEVISNMQQRLTREDLSRLSDAAITTILDEDLRFRRS